MFYIFIAWYVHGGITQKRQEKEEGTPNTVIFKEKEGKEKERSISITVKNIRIKMENERKTEKVKEWEEKWRENYWGGMTQTQIHKNTHAPLQAV